MRLAIVSGYFNPAHLGHLNMFKEARMMVDGLIIIVNNDKQQVLKKGKVIMDEKERVELIKACKYADYVYLSVDDNETICNSLEYIAMTHPEDTLIFCNGGNDRTNINQIPETKTCEENNIRMIFGVGGIHKENSSSKINKLRGEE